MKKSISIFLTAILLVSSITSISMAKPKKEKFKHQKKQSYTHNSVDNNLMKRIFNIGDKEINYFKNLNISREELGLILYLYSLSNKEITANDIDFIVKNKDNMARLTWYLGLPPIIFEDGIITLHHPKLDRTLPPLGQRVYQNKRKGPIKEKIDIDDKKYEYDNKPAKIKEKIEIKSDKYEYKYQNRRLGIEEKLEVKYPSYKYEYHYKNTRTGENIKKEGRGYPLNPKYFYQRLKDKKEEESNFNVSIRININL